MKKIWDTQNNQPLYAINEAALHRGIRNKRNRARWSSNFTEVSLIFIAIVTGTYSLIKTFGGDNIYAYPPAIMLLLTGVYVFIGRFRRKKIEKQYDQSLLGDLDQAIANVNFEIKRARTFVWWYILPIALAVILNMVMNSASVWKWLLISGAFLISYFVVQFGLKRMQIPYRRRLEGLREKLTKEFTEVRHRRFNKPFN